LSNWEFGVDLTAIVEQVESAETFSIFFPTLRRSLIVDMRRGPEDGPMVRVLPMARSPHDRLRSLRRMRPHLPRATQMVAIPWPTYVENLVRSGVWAKLQDRMDQINASQAEQDLVRALAELRQYESQELTALIRGDNYDTIWARES